METTTVIDLNQYKLDTTFYKDHLVHTVSSVNRHLAPSKKTWKQVKQIGEGGFGSVWLEEEVPTGELRAVKRVYRERNRNVDRELRALIKMESHRDLFVQFLGWYEDDRDIFIAMEYHESGDLGRYLKTFRSKARSEVKEITGQLLEGLVALHQNHIYHRDLKPNNVLIACHSPIQVKLADFGTSKSTVNTLLRTRCGTAGYMAPETLGLVPRERGAYTTALDIWSLGCVIYEILTSEIPFLEKFVDTSTSESFTHGTPETDMHLFSQFCLGNIDLPVECLRASGASEGGVNFLRKLLVANPTSRISAVDALRSRWLFEFPDELDREGGSDILREQFWSLGLGFDPQTMDPLVAQCKERRDVDISGILVYSGIKRLPSLVSAAVRMGHALVVELLLQTAENLHPGSSKIIDDAAARNLRSAAKRGHPRIVRLLLERGANVNATSSLGWTALHGAATNGHLEVVRLLLGNGADVNIKGDRDWTALCEAVKNGHPEVVRVLLENGADPNITNGSGWAALGEAVKNGYLEVVILLLERGVDVNRMDYWYRTALHEAANSGHLEVVRVLLENGADPNITNGSGWTALGEAAKDGYLEVVRLLLERGADVNGMNFWDRIALHEAAKAGRLEIVRVLLENGADPNITNSSGWTALDEAAENGHHEVVRLLLENGADPNITNCSGWTALGGAAKNGHLEVVRLLLERGADVNATNYWYRTALGGAVNAGHLEVVRVLLENGADPNITNVSGWTALDGAAKNGHIEVVRLLLENGADPNITNDSGCTAFGEAAENRQQRTGITR